MIHVDEICAITEPPRERDWEAEARADIERAAARYSTLGRSGFRDFAFEDKLPQSRRTKHAREVRWDRVQLQHCVHDVLSFRRDKSSLRSGETALDFRSLQREADWIMGYLVPAGALIVVALREDFKPVMRLDKLGRPVFTGSLVPVAAKPAPQPIG
jgi:hypothetical protein